MDSEEIIKTFSMKYRVKLHPTSPYKADRWGVRHGDELVVPGKYGEIAAPFGDGKLRLRLTAVPRNNTTMNKALNGRAEQAEAGGMRLHQRNGYETVWLFSADNDAHCRLAIELVAPRRKAVRTLSESQKEALRVRMALARAAKMPPSGQNDVLNAVS